MPPLKKAPPSETSHKDCSLHPSPPTHSKDFMEVFGKQARLLRNTSSVIFIQSGGSNDADDFVDDMGGSCKCSAHKHWPHMIELEEMGWSDLPRSDSLPCSSQD